MNIFIKNMLFFFIFALPCCTDANAPNFGTISGNIFPEESVDSIQMIQERVYVKLYKESSHVTCSFWLFNSGSDKTITIGFPDNYFGFNFSNPIDNIKCKVNGQPKEDISAVKLEETKYLKKKECVECIDPGPVLQRPVVKKHWYKWKTFIEENDTVKIEIEYDGKWGGGFCGRTFSYVIGTGLLWDGPILNGRVVFDHSELVSTNFVYKNGNNGKLKPEYFDDSTVYSFNNYIPKQLESLGIGIFRIDWHPLDNYESNRCPDSRNVTSVQQAKGMINEFYALHGFAFKDEILSQYYKKRKWYKIDNSFDSTKLSEGDNKFLENVSKIERAYEKKQ